MIHIINGLRIVTQVILLTSFAFSCLFWSLFFWNGTQVDNIDIILKAIGQNKKLKIDE